MLISDEYRSLNASMHDSPSFGTEGHKYGERVYRIAQHFNITELLDYGCGKCTLAKSLSLSDLKIRHYDPAIPEFSNSPDPAQLLACTDVLEHIEPEYFYAVLEDIRRCTKQVGYFVVTTTPAKKLLSDGTNPHRIIRPILWWHEQLAKHFEILRIHAIVRMKRYEIVAHAS